jgi:hypothetical protein
MPNFTMMLTEADESGNQVLVDVSTAKTDRLRTLCQKEVQRFEDYCRATDPNFRDGGFAKFELRVLEGYLYQKVKGHIDAFHNPPTEEPHG